MSSQTLLKTNYTVEILVDGQWKILVSDLTRKAALDIMNSMIFDGWRRIGRN